MAGSDSFSLIQRKLEHIDIYRDTPIRYLGYANEVRESFRSMIPSVAVKATYVLALGYACTDALDKSKKVHKQHWSSPDERRKQVAIAAGDTFLWQALASVAIPGFTINRICHFSGLALQKRVRVLLSIAALCCGLRIHHGILHIIAAKETFSYELEQIGVSSWPAPVRKWVVTAIGLGTIPLIVHPIDSAVEVGMNETVRRYYNASSGKKD